MHDKTELHKELARRLKRALHYALEREQRSSGLRKELEQLRLQLAATEAERDAAQQAIGELASQRDSIQKEVQTLKSSLAETTSRLQARRQPENHTSSTRPWSHVTMAAVSVLTVAILFTTAFVFHDAQSKVNNNDRTAVASVNALETAPLVNYDRRFADGKQPPPSSGKGRARFVRIKTATHRQWGPALLIPKPEAAKTPLVFDPLVKAQQQDLRTLGFDLGKADGFKGMRTRQAIAEFRALYLPESAKQPQGSDLAAIIRNYANLARRDADRFGIDRGVLAAIRLSSVRTGVDFSYLMKLAATESNFEPASESAASSATGMYQFTRDTWLNALKTHGGKYGLADYTAKIAYNVTRGGYRRPVVRDKAVYRHLLALRKNPRLSAMMAAESVRDSQKKLAQSIGREPTQADLYLAHFLGADGAVTFLKSLEHNPGMFAVDIFPEAARSNQDIFHPQTCDPRTVDEVYELFGEKFSSRRYDDLAAN